MKILLTGASGMVGKNILEHNLSCNHTFLTPNRFELNLLDSDSTYNYLLKYKPDFIIHAAGIVGGIQANMAEPVKFLTENMQMSLNIITLARKLKVIPLMNISSSCMYPRTVTNPISEEQIMQGPIETTNEGYALAKIASTRLCEYINSENKIFLYKTVIPCNLYGRHDKFDTKHSHMLPAAIKKISDAKKNGLERIDVWGSGLARREFMYAGDFADFIFFAMQNFEYMPQNINVGLGIDYTINEYYEVISKIIDYKGTFFHDNTKPVGIMQKLIDTTKLSHFGWTHKTKLEDGIKLTLEFYLTTST